jgi:hypothetical protein
MSTAEVTDIAIRQQPTEMSVEQMIAQTQKIQLCMRAVMKEGEHFGVIPGTKTKPTLLKPGAEKLCLMFRLDPQYEIMSAVETPERISFTVRCTLYHIPTGSRIASGLGSCNSRENKYIRPAPKTCPQCGGAFLIDGNPDYEKDAAYKGGMLCYKKKGGCGAKFKPDDEKITKQATGIADPADLHNTILKMGCKRALVAAVLNGTAASDFFTQDLDDLADKAAAAGEPEYIAPDDNQRIRDAIGEPPAPKASAPSAAPPATAATTSKPSQIKHDGTFASHKQVTLLHVLRSKLGMKECKGDCAVEVEKQTKWGRPPTKVINRCTYHKQLASFRDCDGKPITTSKDLSEAQISNLLDRYEARLKADEETRKADMPDLGVIDAATDTQVDELSMAIAGVEDSEKCAELICDVLKVMSITDLTTKDRVSQGLAIALAYGTKALEPLLAKIRGQA